MKKICIVLFALGVMPLGNAVAVETQAVGDKMQQLYLDDSALNTPEGLSKIKNNQYLQNLLYSRVIKMDKGDRYNWYQHSEFGKFILSQAGQDWIETYAGNEWLKQAQWFDWLKKNAEKTWVFNNAAISWLNSDAALRWVVKDVGKNQFSNLMVYCVDKQNAQYQSDCEILKNTKAGKAFYNHSESMSSDHLFPSNTLQNPSTQSRGQTDSGFDNKGFHDGKPSFGQLNNNNYSEFNPSLLNSANLSILGGGVAAVTAIPAISYTINRNAETDNDSGFTQQLRQCANIANGIACDLESEVDTRTLLGDLERSWDLQINNQSLAHLLNRQLSQHIDQEYALGRTMTSDNMSAVLTLIVGQAIASADVRHQNVSAMPQPVNNDFNMANIITIGRSNDGHGMITIATAIDQIVTNFNMLENQTRLFPILQNGHFYLIAIHRAEDRSYQVLVFDSAAVNTQHSSLVRGVITRLQQQINQPVTVLEYSRGIQARNDCGFYVTYLMHRLINMGFSRVVHDLGLVNNSEDTLFRSIRESVTLSGLRMMVEDYIMPNPSRRMMRQSRSVWLRNYFTQLDHLTQNNNYSAIEQSFLNHIARNNAFTDVSSLELLSYQMRRDPYVDNAIDHHNISETLLQSIGNAQDRNLSNSERRLILESHQGAVAPLTNPFVESALTRGIEVGLDSINKKVVVNVILDEDAPNNSHIRLDLTVPIIAAETDSAVGDLVASANIYFEQQLKKKMTKGKQKRKSKNQGYQAPVKQTLVYEDIRMRFEAKPDSRRV
ncbi:MULTISPECIES: hypothetical protein [Cysteiniphilum]|uniref:Uncharacterized protein n=1 Tax=Cysteiniphilum litorale TaxID=2056700 RepID=A0A8J2Z541_9GAMM|nr:MULTISPECIES: hypothetical protein [Cysteiniphilum]GGG01031.1 hypothetical protein GCM10010995_18080 [Cysteiniphilum litorale]